MGRAEVRRRIAALSDRVATQLVPRGEDAERRYLRVLLRTPGLLGPVAGVVVNDDVSRLSDDELRLELWLLVQRLEADLGLAPIEDDRAFAAVPMAELHERLRQAPQTRPLTTAQED